MRLQAGITQALPNGCGVQTRSKVRTQGGPDPIVLRQNAVE